VSYVSDAFVWREKLKRDGEEAADLLVTARTGRAQEGFQFSERELDRVEVRAVGRKEPNVRAYALDSGADVRLLMGRQIVEYNDVAQLQCGHQHLLDVREKTETIDRPIEDGRGAKAIEAKGSHDGVRLPVTAGRVITKSRATRAATVPPQEVGRHPAFIEKDVPLNIAERLPRAPTTTLSDDVGAALFVGVYGFF
jgi:hypothetical protein